MRVIQWALSLLDPLPADMRRGVIAALCAAPFAFGLGVVIALLLPNHYLSTAAFIAESQDTRSLGSSGLGALAGQFGISAGLGGSQSAAYFADLLATRSTLQPLLDVPVITTQDTVPRPLIERLRVNPPDPREREERALARLRNALRITPDAKTNVVSLSVDSKDPLLAYQIAQALLASLDQFNVSVRRSRARNEREFLEGRVAAVQTDLHAAEAELEHFLLGNRGDTRASPSLAFREVGLRRKLDMAQTRFVDLQRQLDQARVQEVRDTPAITVIDKPNLPVRRDRPRRKKIVMVVLITGMLAAYGLSRLVSMIRASEQRSGALR